MNELSIEISENRTAFQNGDEITGTARWQLDHPPREIELRLFWFTRGESNQDEGVVDACRFENPGTQDSRPFRVRLPEGPCSFSGKLFSIVWAIELVPKPGKDVARVEIVVGPDGRAVTVSEC